MYGKMSTGGGPIYERPARFRESNHCLPVSKCLLSIYYVPSTEYLAMNRQDNPCPHGDYTLVHVSRLTPGWEERGRIQIGGT